MLLALHYGFIASKIIYLHTHGSSSAVVESSSGTHNAIIFNEIWQHSAVNIVRNYTESKHFIAIFNEILGYSMDAARTKHEIYAHIFERMGVILLPLSVPLANTKNIEPKFLRLIEMSKEHTDHEQEICYATEVGVKAWHHNHFHDLNAYIIFMLCELILEKSIHIYGNILVNSNEVKFEPVQFLLDKFVRHLDDKYRNALQEYKKHNSYIVKYVNIIDIMAYNPNESNLMDFLCDNYTRDDVIICSFDFMTSLGGIDIKFGENKIKGDKMKINARNLQRAYDAINDMSQWLNVHKFSTVLRFFVRKEPVSLYSSYYYASDLLFYNTLHKEQYMNFAKLSVKLNDKIIEMFKSAFKTN